MNCIKLLIAITLLFSCSYSQGKDNPPKPYVNDNLVDPELWDALTPYFLPISFPEKSTYDKIYKKRRVLRSVKDMHKAGFLVFTNPKNKMIVARHYKTPGFLTKVYLDSADAVDWYWWKKRIDGANAIRAAIESHGYQAILKAPKKWMYPVPAIPAPELYEGIPRKNFVLIVENMYPLSPDANRKAYKKWISKEHLKALYTIITELGLLDSVYCDNIPFCEDGKIAFLDTEHSMNAEEIPLSNIGQYLNKEMLGWWEQLLNGNEI